MAENENPAPVLADHELLDYEDGMIDEQDVAGAHPVAAAVAGVAAGEQHGNEENAGAEEHPAEEAAAASGLRVLTPDEQDELEHLQYQLQRSGAKYPTPGLLESMYRYSPKEARAAVRAAFDAGSSKSSEQRQESKFDMAKALKSRPGQLFGIEGSGKQNPKNIEAFLDSCWDYMDACDVPPHKKFQYASFEFLDADARAVVFPKSQDGTGAANRTWEEFRAAVLNSPLGCRKETDLQLRTKCLALSYKGSILQLLTSAEALIGRMQVQPAEMEKISLVWQALPAKLQAELELNADNKPYTMYALFRAALVSRAESFDKQAALEAGKGGSGGSGGSGGNGGNGNANGHSGGNARKQRRWRRQGNGDGSHRGSLKQRGKRNGSGSANGSNGQQGNGSDSRDNYRCHGCGKLGHIRRDCPNKKSK